MRVDDIRYESNGEIGAGHEDPYGDDRIAVVE